MIELDQVHSHKVNVGFSVQNQSIPAEYIIFIEVALLNV